MQRDTHTQRECVEKRDGKRLQRGRGKMVSPRNGSDGANAALDRPMEEDPPAQAISKPMKIDDELQGDEFGPLSGKPYFHFVLGRQHLLRPYQLAIPSKLREVLPSALIPASLACQSKTWKMVYHGESGTRRRIDRGWKKFLIENDLKVGDACVFELVDSSIEEIKFRVKILGGDLPPEFLKMMNADAAESPIIIE